MHKNPFPPNGGSPLSSPRLKPGASRGYSVNDVDRQHHGTAAGQVIDPVCHMHVTVNGATPRSTHAGQTYYFCAPGCKTTFDKDPVKYAG